VDAPDPVRDRDSGEEPSVTPGQAGRTTRAATRTAEARRLDRAVGPAPLRNDCVEGTSVVEGTP